MKYFKMYTDDSTEIEITKEEARRCLDGWWKEEALNDIFENNKSFRLWTPYVIISTKTETGFAVKFMGICETQCEKES